MINQARRHTNLIGISNEIEGVQTENEGVWVGVGKPDKLYNKNSIRGKLTLDRKDFDKPLIIDDIEDNNFSDSIPIIVCDNCCDFEEELTMGKARNNCDLCGCVLDDYHWRWGKKSELYNNFSKSAFKIFHK